jgi:sugar phosphate isomerase/epimerase
MNRRSFVQTVGAAVAGAPLAPRLMAPTRLTRIGLELYSVRDAMKADPEATLAKVKAMGYDDVELLWSFDNFGRTPQQVRATLEREGLGAPSAHIAPEILLKDWDKSVDTARYLGHKFLIVPSLPAETNRSLDAWRLWAGRFNNAGAVANKGGVWLAFHNEPEHQKPIDGQVPYDLFLQLTDPSVVAHQLDFGNMTVGGGDPLTYIQKYRDRFRTFHIKDVVADRKRDTELGAGVLDLRKLMAAIPDINNKPCYVEQESPADPLASAAKNCAYLRNLEF